MHNIIRHVVHEILLSNFDAGDVEALVAISHEPCRVSNKADKTAENYSQQTILISSSREIGNRVRDDVLTGTQHRDLVLNAKLLFDFLITHNRSRILHVPKTRRVMGKNRPVFSYIISNGYIFIITTGQRLPFLHSIQVYDRGCKNQNLLTEHFYLFIETL